MDNTIYSTGTDKWQHGEKLNGHNEWHRHLGPCPNCGSRTFDYGGGWRCVTRYCFNSANNSIGNLGPSPKWWNTGVQVFKDGDQWCAVNADFINLQESNAGFGAVPQDAVDNLLTPQPNHP